MNVQTIVSTNTNPNAIEHVTRDERILIGLDIMITNIPSLASVNKIFLCF